MPRRTTTRRTGRRTVYTEHRAQTIITAVLTGNHITTACGLAGIHTATLYTWLNKADDVETAINNGTDYPHEWEVYLDFRDRLQVARAQAEEFAVSVVRSEMEGGRLISEEPLLNEQGEVQYDEHGRIVAKRTWSGPNGRLAMTYLARSAPEKWGEKARVEVLTADGAPAADVTENGVEEEVVAGALELAGRLAATQRARDSGHDVVDAEIVEDAAS